MESSTAEHELFAELPMTPCEPGEKLTASSASSSTIKQEPPKNELVRERPSWSPLVAKAGFRLELEEWDTRRVSEFEGFTEKPEAIKFISFVGPSNRATKTAVNILLNHFEKNSNAKIASNAGVVIREKFIRVSTGRGKSIPVAGYVLAINSDLTSQQNSSMVAFCARASSVVCIVITDTHADTMKQVRDTLSHLVNSCHNVEKPTLWVMFLIGENLWKQVGDPIWTEAKSFASRNQLFKSVKNLLANASGRFKNVIFSANPVKPEAFNGKTRTFLKEIINGAPCRDFNFDNASRKLISIARVSLIKYDYIKEPYFSMEQNKLFQQGVGMKMIQKQYEFMTSLQPVELKLKSIVLQQKDQQWKRFKWSECGIRLQLKLEKFNNRMTRFASIISEFNIFAHPEALGTKSSQPSLTETLAELDLDWDLIRKMTTEDQKLLLDAQFCMLEKIIFKLALEHLVSQFRNKVKKYWLNNKVTTTLSDFRKEESKIITSNNLKVATFLRNFLDATAVDLLEKRLEQEYKVVRKELQDEVEMFEEKINLSFLAGIKVYRKIYASLGENVRIKFIDYLYNTIIAFEKPDMREQCAIPFKTFVEQQKYLDVPTVSPGTLTEPRKILRHYITTIRDKLRVGDERIESLVAIEALIDVENASEIYRKCTDNDTIREAIGHLQDVADGLYIIRYKQNKTDQSKHGMKKCDRNTCKCCDVVLQQSIFSNKDFTFRMNDTLDCASENVIYYITCVKEECKTSTYSYIGKTEDSLKDRIAQYRSKIGKPSSQLVLNHFDKASGHSFEKHFRVAALIKTSTRSISRREHQFIFAFKSKKSDTGLNIHGNEEVAGIKRL